MRLLKILSRIFFHIQIHGRLFRVTLFYLPDKDGHCDGENHSKNNDSQADVGNILQSLSPQGPHVWMKRSRSELHVRIISLREYPRSLFVESLNDGRKTIKNGRKNVLPWKEFILKERIKERKTTKKWKKKRTAMTGTHFGSFSKT